MSTQLASCEDISDGSISIELNDNDNFEPPSRSFQLDLEKDVCMVKQAAKPYANISPASINFLKGCKWSPDGSCLLSNSDDKVIRLFNLPEEFCKEPMEVNSEQEMLPVLSMKESELIYDYCWYPRMNSADPSSCFFITTGRNNPIHLWDAYGGKVFASFTPYNHLDELISPYSLCFSPDGDKVFAGFKKSIKIFYTALPGRVCEDRKTYAEKCGQHGIISSIAICSRRKNLYALGSYTKQIGLYEEPSGETICILIGHKGGITNLAFSPDGTKLFSGGRKDSEILCWDLRNVGTVLYSMRRCINTHQRVYFDVSCDGHYLASGSDDGFIHIWDLTRENVENGVFPPTKSYLAHVNGTNGSSWHPTLPLLATSSGQREWPNFNELEEEDSLFDVSKDHEDNKLSLWWFATNPINS